VDSRERAVLIGQLAGEKKGGKVTVLELTGLTDIADYFVIADGTSERQVRTIAETIELEMKGQGFRPVAVEGMDEGRWVIIDYGDVVAHVFLEPLRELYDLESLWIEAKRFGIAVENKI
jgi:ribosome-associated protein